MLTTLTPECELHRCTVNGQSFLFKSVTCGERSSHWTYLDAEAYCGSSSGAVLSYSYSFVPWASVLDPFIESQRSVATAYDYADLCCTDGRSICENFATEYAPQQLCRDPGTYDAEAAVWSSCAFIFNGSASAHFVSNFACPGGFASYCPVVAGSCDYATEENLYACVSESATEDECSSAEMCK